MLPHPEHTLSRESTHDKHLDEVLLTANQDAHDLHPIAVGSGCCRVIACMSQHLEVSRCRAMCNGGHRPATRVVVCALTDG